jgi:hypothetical protein
MEAWFQGMALRKRTPAQPVLESLEERLDREVQSTELVDFPAAVVCTLCGQSDCPGCDSEQSKSGIVAIIAWERAGAPMLSRLWSTARATTRDAEGFFELMPDGPVMPALRFAATCEMLAATAVIALVVPVAAVVAPDWLRHVALDEHARSLALRVLVLGLPAFAGLLVLAHAAHGLSIDVGAAKNGARHARSRALRFGLYACGWDLVIGPIGALVVAVKEGLGASLKILELASGLPTRATEAFLRGCYRLEGDRAKRALGTSYVGAAFATLAGALLILAAIVALVLA